MGGCHQTKSRGTEGVTELTALPEREWLELRGDRVCRCRFTSLHVFRLNPHSPELSRSKRASMKLINFQHPTPPATWKAQERTAPSVWIHPTSPGFPIPFSVSESYSWPAPLTLAATCSHLRSRFTRAHELESGRSRFGVLVTLEFHLNSKADVHQRADNAPPLAPRPWHGGRLLGP